nr:nuclear transport factor 2 family protein [uncultured Sphingomonas sp.]
MILIFALAAAASATPAVPTVPAEPALTTAITASDKALFDLMFDRCDPAGLRAMVTPDMEFYHDKGGVMDGADAFVADYAKGCAAKKAPDAWRSRRVLVPGSMHVSPVPGFGAIETGEHLFYERQGEGPQRLVGRASFAIVWALGDDGKWRMRRVLSYAHAAAGDEKR